MVSKTDLLARLPEYRDEWVVIHPDQTVKDIIEEVLAAHDEFAPYYDKIAICFDGDTAQEISKDLYDFCKENIAYLEETEDSQTSALPTGILTRGHGDCKHYAGFVGGILDALNRQGKRLTWCYRFASYDPLDTVPHHVFIVVTDRGGNEIWIDPTPGSELKSPVYQVDKYIKASKMALKRNIAGVEYDDELPARIGIASLTVTPFTQAGENQLNFTGTESRILSGMWPQYLGLSDYRDYSGDRSINEWNVAAQLNAIIAQHGGTHQVTGDFVKWVYDNSIRSWNFLYPGGIDPSFDGAYWLGVYRNGMQQPGWPEWVITPDGRLTIDHDVKLDDYRNAGIEIMTAWGQNLINTYDKTPYPVKPAAVKEFSQGYTGNPGNTNANFFNEARGTGLLTDIGKALESAVNWVKDVGLMVIGSIPRNAFLSLVGLNVFHMATDLARSIENGHWDEIANTWRNLGGDPDKLRNTIEHGSGQPAIEAVSQQVDETIGVVQVAALIAAAGPIIVALLKFMNSDGKLNPMIKSAETTLQTQFPGADFSFLNGALTSGGQPVHYSVNPIYDQNSPLYNPNAGNTLLGSLDTRALLIAGGVGAGVYFLVNKKGQVKKNYIIPAGAAVLAYFMLRKTVTPVQAIQPAPAQTTQTATNPSLAQTLLPALADSYAAYTEATATQPAPTDTSVDFNLYSNLNQNYATV